LLFPVTFLTVQVMVAWHLPALFIGSARVAESKEAMSWLLLKHHQYIWMRLRPHAFFWDALSTCRSLLLAIFIACAPFGSSLQLFFCILLTLAVLILVFKYSPHVHRGVSIFEGCSVAAYLLVAISRMSLLSADTEDSAADTEYSATTILTIGIAACAVAYSLYVVGLAYLLFMGNGHQCSKPLLKKNAARAQEFIDEVRNVSRVSSHLLQSVLFHLLLQMDRQTIASWIKMAACFEQVMEPPVEREGKYRASRLCAYEFHTDEINKELSEMTKNSRMVSESTGGMSVTISSLSRRTDIQVVRSNSMASNRRSTDDTADEDIL